MRAAPSRPRTAFHGAAEVTLLALVLAAPLTLSDLQAAAARADPRVLSALADVEHMRGLSDEADAARWPVISYLAVGGAPVPQYTNDPNHLDNVDAGSRLGNYQLGNWGFLVHGNVTLALPVFTFGKIAAYRAAAAKGVEATGALADAARAQAAHDAAVAFWGYQLARAVLLGMDAADGQLAEARARVAQLLAAHSPQVTRSDLDKVDLVRAELRSKKSEATHGLALALDAGRLLTNTAPGAPIAFAEAKLEPAPVKLVAPERYGDAAVANRPEVVAARAALVARGELALEKHRELLPDVLVVGLADGSYSNAATRQTNPFAYDPYNGRTAGAGVAVRGNLDVFKVAARARQADADRDKAFADTQLAEKGVRLQAAMAVSALGIAVDRAAAMQDESVSARRWATSAQLAFDAGTGEASDVLFAALAYARASAEVLTASRDAEVALADLRLAIGTDPAELR